MMDEETQKKLDRLEKLEQAGRDRSKKYLEKIKAEGKKQISAIVSSEAYEELNRRRDESIRVGRPLSFGGVIECILLQDAKPNIDIIPNVKESIKSNAKDSVNIDVKRTDTIQDLNQILLNLEPGTWKEKAKRLNDKSILTASGKTWTDNNLRMAVKNIQEAKP